ncbi:MAG: helix-turn-helix domain containing protein [Myxococcota bacterium]|nr:helix-turn-helix domain containing protein [Myxococcota bacterium]
MMPPPAAPTLQWIRPPRQARTQETLERLLDAAEALLEEKHFEDVHIAEIASRAQTSVAAFYRRFNDKEGLLHALHERLCEEAFATADSALAPERWEGAGLRAILDTVVPFLISVFEDRQALDLAVYQRGLTDESMRERSHRLIRYVLEGLGELILERREEILHEQPEQAVSFAMMQTAATLTHLYTARFRDVGTPRMNDKQIADETVRSCLAYLMTERTVFAQSNFKNQSGESQ